MNISEEFEKRLQVKPDQWTTAWWSSQFQEVLLSNRGLKHALHLALADNEDLGKAVKEVREQIHILYANGVADRAKIGELQARLDRQGEFLNQLKAKEK